MTGCYHRSLRLLLVTLTLGGIPMGARSWAQDDWDAAERQVVQQAAGVALQAGFEIPEETFDQWVFGNATGQGKERLGTRLTLQIASVERVCSLSDAQKKKLLLAGEGDMKRFLDRVEESREKFRAVRRDQNNFNQIWQDIQPLQMKFNSGFFDDSSLFRKVLVKTLDSDQLKQYEQREFERRRFRYEASIASAIATLEDGVPLRDQQRQKLTRLLVEETQPPEKFGQYDYYVVLYKAAKLPEEKLKPVFDDAQWRALTQTFAQAAGMELHLKRNGFIP